MDTSHALESDPAAATPWWDALPADFYKQPCATPLDREQPFTVGTTAAIDHVVRSVLGAGICLAAVQPWITSARHRQRSVERGLKFYEELAAAGDSSRSFPAPPKVAVRSVEAKGVRSRGGKIPCRKLSFNSPFEPLHPTMRKGYLRHQGNTVAHAEHWYHEDGPRPTLILVHGFMASHPVYNARMFSLEWFHRNGYDVLLYTLPFHGLRRAKADWFSGSGLLVHGMAHFNEGMAHGIHDLRIFMDHLESTGVSKIGISGFSLGGYTSSLMASVDERLAFCIPNSPATSLADIAREWQPSGSVMELFMGLRHIDMHALRAGTAVNSALSYKLRIDPARVLVIGGAGDRLASPRQVQLLHDHWPGSALRWFPGNHLLHVSQGDYLREMKRFMDQHTSSDATTPRAKSA